MLKISLISILCASTLLLSACHDDKDAALPSTAVQPYAIDADISAWVNQHDVLRYRMPSVQQQMIDATALVFTPKGSAPVGGWPVVVWAHGTTGVADQCAPSNQPLPAIEKSLILGLLQQGYAVVAPDYEGLGHLQHAHPYLHVESAANSILSALDAAYAHYAQLSKQWSVVGWSQGGHAVLAVSEYADQRPYQFKGGVAIAPASYLVENFHYGVEAAKHMAAAGDFAAAIEVSANLHTFVALVANAIQADNPRFDLTQVFLNDKVNLAQTAARECSIQVGQNFAIDVQQSLQRGLGFEQYQALQTKFAEDVDVQAYLAKTLPATQPLAYPVHIYQGTADSAVPYDITAHLVENMRAQGSTVHFVALENEDHNSVIPAHLAKILGSVNQLMQAPSAF